MKVILINPPVDNMMVNVPEDMIQFRDVGYPNLGLMYIAAVAEKNSDHDIRIFDMQIEHADEGKLEEHLRRERPDVVGVPATSFTLIDALITCRVAKQANPETLTVLGGRHGSLYPRETANLENVDFVVVNEGEYAFLDLLREIEGARKYETVQGIAFRKDGETVFTGHRPWIDPIDDLPFPARHLTPYTKYKYALAGNHLFTTLMTSRGCPHGCVFCDRSQGRRFRIRSAENVADEMEECYRMGITEVFVKDDTFTVDRDRTLRICDEIIRRELQLVLCIRTRVDLVSEDVIARLKQAGCTRIQFGIESGNQRVLDLLKKNITLDQVRRAVRLAKRYDMDTLGEFMIGSPGESSREVSDTLGFAVELELDYVLFNITTPYPGTELYRMGMERGLFDDFWQAFARDPVSNARLRFWTESFSEEELRALIRKVYKRYYVRPRYVMKRISKVKSVWELMEKTRFAFKIFGM